MCFRPPTSCGPSPFYPPPCVIIPSGVAPPPAVLPPGSLVSRYNAGYYCIITRVEYLVSEVRIFIEENGDGSYGPCQPAIASRVIDSTSGQQHRPISSDLREPIPSRKIVGYISFSRSIFVEGVVFFFEYGQSGYSRVPLPPPPALPTPTPTPGPTPPPTTELISRYNNDYYCVILNVQYLVTEVKIFFEVNGNLSLGDLQPPNLSRVIDGTTNQPYHPISTDYRVVIPGRKIAGSLSYQRSVFIVGRTFYFEYGSAGYSRVQLPAPPAEPVQPPQPTQPQSTLTFPSGTPITVIVTANAGYKQRVTINEKSGAFKRVYLGVGEGVQLGRDTINVSSSASTITVEVTIEHSTDGGSTWKASEVRAGSVVESGRVRSLTVISNDSGGDRDFNDAIVQFSWNVTPVNPLPAPVSKATLELPSSTQITVNVTTNAGWLQRATLAAQNGQFSRVYSGSGEGREIGRETFQVSNGQAKFTLDLTAEHSTDGGFTWKGSDLRVGQVSKTATLNQLIVTVDDSAGDRDYNDLVLVFTWNDTVVPASGIVTGEYYLQAVVSGYYLDGETTEVEQFDRGHPRPYLTSLHPGDSSQIWRVEELSAGVYILINSSNFHALDSNIHVPQYRPDFVTPFFWTPVKTAANHQWKLTSVGNQLYTLTSVAYNVLLSGRITDTARPYPALVSTSTDVSVHWKLVPKSQITYIPRPCPEPETPKPTLEEGEYYLQSVSAGTYLNGNHSLAKQLDANLPRPFLSKLTPGDAFLLWKIASVGDGKFTLFNLGANKALDGNINVPRLEPNYPQPFFYTLTPTAANHQWKLISLGNTYLVVNVYANLAIDANVGACKHADPEKPCPFFWKYTLDNVGVNHQWRLIPRKLIPVDEIPKPTDVTPIPITFPSGVQLSLRVTTNAGWLQRVTVQEIDGGGFRRQYIGSGEGVEIGKDSFTVGNNSKVTVLFEHSPDGGRTWRFSKVKLGKPYQVGCLTQQEVLSEDGGDEDYNDAIVSFSYNTRTSTGGSSSNTVQVSVPSSLVNLRVSVSAGYLQRVTVRETKGRFFKVYVGNGSNVDIGKDALAFDSNSATFDVTFEHSTNGGGSWIPSLVKAGPPNVEQGLGKLTIVSDDSGGDRDYNDAVVHFSWAESSPTGSGGFELKEGTQAVYEVQQFQLSSTLKVTGSLHQAGQNAFALNIQTSAPDAYNNKNVGLQLVYRGDQTHGQFDLYYIQNGQIQSKNISRGFLLKSTAQFEVEFSFSSVETIDLVIRQEQEVRLTAISLNPFNNSDLKQFRLSGVTGLVKIVSVQTVHLGSVIGLILSGTQTTTSSLIGSSQLVPSSIRPGHLRGINDYEKEIGPRYFCWRWFTRGNQKFRLLTIEQGSKTDVVDGPAQYRPTDFAAYAEDYYTGLENTYFCWRSFQRENETFWIVTIENKMQRILEPPYNGTRSILPVHLAGCNGYETQLAPLKFYWRSFQRGSESFRVVTLE